MSVAAFTQPSEDDWALLRVEAASAAAQEPALASYLNAAILNHVHYADALSYHLAHKLGGGALEPMLAREVLSKSFAADPQIIHAALADMRAFCQRDPACINRLQPFLYFKGYQALQAYRAAHQLWTEGRRTLAFHLQSRMSELFGVDIHPAARIGRGVFIDHAHGVVIGETAVVEDDVSILHGVTLGGTGKQHEDRHPKVRRGVLIGAGAKILGNIEVGEGARVAAGSVVLKPVPAHCTVAGVPARRVGSAGCASPAEMMDQRLESASAAPNETE